MAVAQRRFGGNHPRLSLPNGRGMLDERFILFHPGFVTITDGKPLQGLFLAAMVAQQIRHEEQGLYEWPCPMSDWHARVGMTGYQVREAVKSLSSRGLVSIRRLGRPPIQYYCLEWDLFEDCWMEATGTPFRDWYCAQG